MLDFGGVLTNDFWEVLRGFARREGLAENALVDLVTKDVAGAQLLRDLEAGVIGQGEFERVMAERLGVERAGLLARIAADLRPDEVMLEVVGELRARGVLVAILSNSWGSDYYDPYAPWELAARADVVIISDQVRMRKPDPQIFQLAVDKLGVATEECVFVDDIAAYLEPAKAMGMRVLHHRDTAKTVEELRGLFGRFVAGDDLLR